MRWRDLAKKKSFMDTDSSVVITGGRGLVEVGEGMRINSNGKTKNIEKIKK